MITTHGNVRRAWRRRACGWCAPSTSRRPYRIEGDEHGEVEYALHRADWHDSDS